MTELPDPPHDLDALARLSARIGADPLLIQGAGGNTSVKDGGVMWIKASGTQLADACRRDIFVATDLDAMRAALSDPDLADQPAQFLLAGQTLRPSIETSLHAVFEHRVVVHVHCVETIAVAVRADAEIILEDRLKDFDWCFTPYAKPGAQLAARVIAARGPETDVVVLGNHGLIVAAERVEAAEDLLTRVVAALRSDPAPAVPVDLAALTEKAEEGWSVPGAEAPVHQIALDQARTRQAATGSLYPDHVIFCGPAVSVAGADTLSGDLPAPAIRLLPGLGALIRSDASEGTLALARCLGDVLARVPEGAKLRYLTRVEEAALLNWDAEKYRQALDA